MSQVKNIDIDSLVGGIQETKQLTVKSKTSKTKGRLLKNNKKVTRQSALRDIKESTNTADIMKKHILKTTQLAGRDLNITNIATTKPQKELLQNILRKHNIDENAVAEALITLKDDPDYRARESFIDRSVRFLGYDYANKEQQSTTTNNVVFMPDILIKKYKKDSNINQIIEEGDLIAE
jgi:hypothetical protein